MFRKLLIVCCFSHALHAQDMVTVSDTFYFESASASLSKESRGKLRARADEFIKFRQLTIKITGHTDSIGSESYNQLLGERRARALAAALSQFAIGNKRITISSEGESQAVASNATEYGRTLNRRAVVEWKAYKGESQPTLHLSVSDEEGQPLKATITLEDGKSRMQTFSFADSVLALNRTERYKILIDAEGYFSESLDLVPADSMKHDHFSRHVVLRKAEVLQVLRFERIHFIPNEAIFAPGSEVDLKKLLAFMQQDTGRIIEIQGHINYALNQPLRIPRVFQEHQTLSVNRAKAVYDYLVSHGINPKRMTYKGLNNSKMLLPYAATMEDAMKNMRVEVLLLK